MKKKILYINKQFRFYDEIKYEVISSKYDLTVLWICPFRSDEFPKKELLSKIKYKILGLKSSRLKPWHFYYNLKLIIIILFLSNYDLVISTTSDSWHSKVVFFIAKIKHLKLAFRKEVWYYNKSNVFTNLNILLTKFIEKRANIIFVPGIKQSDLLNSMHKKLPKTLVFPYLINDRIFTPLKKRQLSKKVRFVFWGRIIPLKGVDLLIKAAKQLETLGFKFELLIIGGPTNQKYQKDKSVNFYRYCKKLSSGSKNIRFIGFIKNENIKLFLNEKTVFIMPNIKYINGKLTGDGWGNSLIEALGFGLPVIVSDRVGSSENAIIEGANGFTLNSDRLEGELLTKMRYFIQNDGLIKDYGRISYNIFKKINNKEILLQSLKEALE